MQNTKRTPILDQAKIRISVKVFINQNSVSIIGSINIDIDHFIDVSQIIIPPSFLIDSNFITVSEPSSLGDIISKEMVYYCKPC